MNKSKVVSYLFVILGFLVIVCSSYLIMSYASDILRAIVDFVTTNDFTKLQQCGVTSPPEFASIRADLTTVILPFLYVGIPLLLVIISALMFLGGFYYHKGKQADDTRSHEELERQLVHKIVSKMEIEKVPPILPPAPKAEAPPEPQEETQSEEETEEEPEEEPPPKPAPKAGRKKK